MSHLHLEECPCGSGLETDANYDNHGIFVFWSCEDCDEGKRKKYNPVIFNDYDGYERLAVENGEQIDGDY